MTRWRLQRCNSEEYKGLPFWLKAFRPTFISPAYESCGDALRATSTFHWSLFFRKYPRASPPVLKVDFPDTSVLKVNSESRVVQQTLILGPQGKHHPWQLMSISVRNWSISIFLYSTSLHDKYKNIKNGSSHLTNVRNHNHRVSRSRAEITGDRIRPTHTANDDNEFTNHRHLSSNKRPGIIDKWPREEPKYRHPHNASLLC